MKHNKKLIIKINLPFFIHSKLLLLCRHPKDMWSSNYQECYNIDCISSDIFGSLVCNLIYLPSTLRVLFIYSVTPIYCSVPFMVSFIWISFTTQNSLNLISSYFLPLSDTSIWLSTCLIIYQSFHFLKTSKLSYLCFTKKTHIFFLLSSHYMSVLIFASSRSYQPQKIFFFYFFA